MEERVPKGRECEKKYNLHSIQKEYDILVRCLCGYKGHNLVIQIQLVAHNRAISQQACLSKKKKKQSLGKEKKHIGAT